MMCGPFNCKFFFLADEFTRKQQVEAKAWPCAIGGSTRKNSLAALASKTKNDRNVKLPKIVKWLLK
jgi:hypothetical protein